MLPRQLPLIVPAITIILFLHQRLAAEPKDQTPNSTMVNPAIKPHSHFGILLPIRSP